MSELSQITNLKNEVERWKAVAEANDRSYCIARDALEMTRKALTEMTQYRDNAIKRLEWSERDKREIEKVVLALKKQLAAEKRRYRPKRATPKRSTDR